MIDRKNLGMGLDLLLNASNNRNFPSSEKTDLEKANLMFEKAIQEEEKGNILEAYYQYRKVIDYFEDYSSVEKNASALLSETFNNMAIILYENGQADAARSYLRQATSICSENQVARENLEILLQEE